MRFIHLFIGTAITLCLASCERQPAGREYEEIVIESPMKSKMGAHGDPHAFMDMGLDQPDAPVAKLSLAWTTPPGWSEEKGSGMRLATFRSQDSTQPVECSIVSLGGEAGGLKPNVIRWMNQINVSVPSDDVLEQFLSEQKSLGTQGGFSLKAVDLTPFTEEEAPSMIAGVADLPGMTIFVKMTGTKEAVVHHREQFKALCRSLKIN